MNGAAGEDLKIKNGAPGRNDPCPCSSGKKYKKCCGQVSVTALSAEPMRQETEAAVLNNQAQAKTLKSDEASRLVAMFNAGRYAEVERTARKLVERHSKSGFAWKILGASLKLQGKDALAALQMATKLLPDDAEVHINLGSALKDLGRLDEALTSYSRAREINPDFAMAHHNLGHVLKDLGQFDDAVASYKRALEIKPDYAEAHFQMGNALKELGQLDAAEASYRRAFEIKPDYVDALGNLSVLLLAQGRYSEAWPFYESRYDRRSKNVSASIIPVLPYQQWRGESLAGRSLLIWTEQGFGDYIQFVRYAPLLKDRGVSQLTLFCVPPLKALLETIAGVDAVITDLAAIPPHDYWSFALSLPLHFGTTVDTIPAALPYLHALPARVERWRVCLPTEGRKVGLVWKGNANHGNDSDRSLPGLATLAPLWNVPEVTFISLQKWQAEEESEQLPAAQPIVALGSDIMDFADTAAIVSQLDLVICVDTAIAHLAGALGKPCWVLLPAFGTDWRWLLDRPDSPWYPGIMRLFRQTKRNDWDGVISEVVVALVNEEWIGAFGIERRLGSWRTSILRWCADRLCARKCVDDDH